MVLVELKTRLKFLIMHLFFMESLTAYLDDSKDKHMTSKRMFSFDYARKFYTSHQDTIDCLGVYAAATGLVILLASLASIYMLK